MTVLSYSTKVFAIYTTYQAKIIKPDGVPLESSNVAFRFTILDPAGSCILYAESFSLINMRGSAGLISFSLGSGIKTYPTSGSVTFQDVFNNQAASFACADGAPDYSPLTNDIRKIVMQFHDGYGWQTMPAMSINHVPYAMYARSAVSATVAANALQLNGKTDVDFVQKNTIPTCSAAQTLQFNGSSFSCVNVQLSGMGTVSSVSATAPLVVTGSASAPVISINVASMSSDGYLTAVDYVEFKAKLSASSSSIVNTLGFAPVSASSVAAQIAESQLSGDVSGTLFANSVVAIGGKSSAAVAESVEATLAASSGNVANTLVKRDSSGYASFSGLSAGLANLNYVDIYKPGSSFNIRLQAPTSLSSSYYLNLPTSSGTAGQVLATDGAGHLSWIDSATGSVTSVSGTPGEITSSGGLTPSLALANAGSAGTYFKVTTDVKGRVVSGITTLVLSDLPNTVLNTTSNFAGDISGIISNITVNRIQGVSVTVSALSSNDILQYNGSQYVNRNIPTCGIGYYLTFNGTNFSCVMDAGASGTISALQSELSAVSATAQAALVKSNNLSDVASATVARNNLGLGAIAQLNAVDLSGSQATGTLAVARLPNFTGDATTVAGSNTIVLSNSGVTPGTYSKVTVDAKGRVTSSSALGLSDVTTALGYTPANAASAGITTLNGSSSSTQIFANGVSGNAPAFLTINGVHTLNIPLASTASVTGGLISNTDYTTFTNKITSSAASVAQVLGYVPAASGSVGVGALLSANNLSDVASATVARNNLGLGSLAVLNAVDLSGSQAIGTLAIARLPNFTGDATTAAGSNTIVLSNSGVAPGTYSKVTVDSKGRVTSSSALGLSDVTTALGYTPANAASAGITTLNGSSSSTQIFANGVNGNAPAFVTTNGVHTLNIPLASTGAVTAGLLSNVDYTTFTNKITSSAASVAQVLGYVPASATALGSYLIKSNNLADVASATVARNNLGLGSLAVLNAVDLSSSQATGTLAIARLPNFTGDATTVAGSNTIVLSNSGVTPGTYSKVIVDAKGRVTSSSALSLSDVTTALGYTPANAASAGITTLNGSSSSTQIFANGVSGNSPAFVTVNGIHTLNIPLASAASVTGGLVSNVDYTTFVNKITSSAVSVAQVLGYVPASATGIIPDSRFMTFSGVTSGTQYTKVTVDGKGRVTSGAQINASDIVAALGYTPGASGAVSSQWTTSGSDINYMIGNVGVGVTNPSASVEVVKSGASSYVGFKSTISSTSANATGVETFASGSNYSTGVLVESESQGATMGVDVYASVTSSGGAYVRGLNVGIDDSLVAGSGLRLFADTGTAKASKAIEISSGFNSGYALYANTNGRSYFKGSVGIGSLNPVTKLEVSGGIRISMESATCAVSYAGTLRYNSGQVEFCNGTSWAAFGVAGAGITSINGSTSSTQTFAYATAGTTTAFSTVNGVHTLNIPLASAASVTGGLVSNADYTTFMNKITSSAASVAQVLGYVPASATALGSYLIKTNNLSDLSNVATARSNLGLGGFATVSSLDLGSASATGTLAVARLPAFNGDVVTTAGSSTMIVDGLQGRAVLSTAPTSGQVLAYNGSAWAPYTVAPSQWITSGTAISYTGGSVGVGTSTISATVTVSGSLLVTDRIKIQGTKGLPAPQMP